MCSGWMMLKEVGQEKGYKCIAGLVWYGNITIIGVFRPNLENLLKISCLAMFSNIF